MNSNLSHKARVHRELLACGLNAYTMLKPSSRYLHNFIRPDEHVLSVISGRSGSGNALLVATNLRMLFLDHLPFFTTSDEFPYTSVTGVSSLKAGLFATVSLHTKLGEYHFVRVNPTSAEHFETFIGNKAVIKGVEPSSTGALPERKLYQLGMLLAPAAQKFLRSHDTAVISTVDRTGNPSGAAVYYLTDETATAIYLLTIRETSKARNLLANGKIHLTIFETDPPCSLQLSGTAQLETDSDTVRRIGGIMEAPRLYRGKPEQPPVMRSGTGELIVLRVTLTAATYQPFNN